MPNKAKTLAIAVLALVAVAACAPRYEFKPVPVRPIDSFANLVHFAGGVVGANPIHDSGELTKIFGFDLKKAGVIPVQIAVRNDRPNGALTLTKATLLDSDGLLWEVLPSDVVVRRIDEHTSGGLTGEQGLRRSLLWGLAGGVLGAAVGVVGGTSVGEAAAKGAAAGAAIGITSSIAQAGTETSDARDIQRDFSTRNIDHATINPGESANGLLYFPAEAARPARLSLGFRAPDGDVEAEVRF
jgi:hypothetical protein